MSSITSTQNIDIQQNYLIEKSTQAADKKLLITQTAEGLRFSVKEHDGTTVTVQNHLIDGLPKVEKVPPQFFQRCFVSAQKNPSTQEYKVSLVPSLLGGGNVHACPPGTNNDHSRYIERTKESCSLSGGGNIGIAELKGNTGKTTTKETTYLKGDCHNPKCRDSSKNPKNP